MFHQIAIETRPVEVLRVRAGTGRHRSCVRRGSVFALLGPNGAGKTTAVRIRATLLAPDGGTARVAGRDVVTERREVRRRISLTGQYAALDEPQTGVENLEVIGRLLGLPGRAARSRARELLAQLDLVEAADRRVSTYSGGMRRRLDIAASLISRPEVLFLDEPTTGLDPRSRQAMWEIVTHLASTSDELKQQVGGQRLDLQLADAAAFDELGNHLGRRVVHRERSALTVGIATDGSASDIRSLLDELDPDCVRVARFSSTA